MRRMGSGEGNKKDVTLMQNEQVIFINMLKYETDHFKTKLTAFCAKTTDADAKQTITNAKPAVMH